jgi:hypothetical protein
MTRNFRILVVGFGIAILAIIFLLFTAPLEAELNLSGNPTTNSVVCNPIPFPENYGIIPNSTENALGNGAGDNRIVYPEEFGAESNPTGNPIGGGAGYNDIISETDPRVKYVVSTKDQLLNALKNAKSGEIVFVKGDADINLTATDSIGIPGGVTLASDRGAKGSCGGRIFRDRLYPVTLENAYDNPTFYVNGDNVRITGLRIEGPDKGQEALETLGIRVKSGFAANDRSGLVFDNNEMWGWSFGAIVLMYSDASIHHNYIHHCQAGGYGYGVDVGGGFADIYANVFDYTRHAVAAGGLEGERYNASYNIHLGHSTHHVFDVHENTRVDPPIAGLRYYIHHNTIYQGIKYPLVRISAVPVDKVYIYNNIFLASYHYAISQYSLPPPRHGNMIVTNNIVGLNNSTGVYYAEGPVLYQP